MGVDGAKLGGGEVEFGLIGGSFIYFFSRFRVFVLFDPKKVSVSKHVGHGSFERYFRGGFNGNNGAVK